MSDSGKQPTYFVLFLTTAYRSLDEVRAKAPEVLSAHLARSQDAHAQGTLLMAGAFLDRPDEPVSTMAVLTTREAAQGVREGRPVRGARHGQQLRHPSLGEHPAVKAQRRRASGTATRIAMVRDRRTQRPLVDLVTGA